MSITGGSTLNVGTLSASFVLNAVPAQAQISNIINQTQTLKSNFSQTFKLNIDNSSAITNINKTTDAARGLKTVLESIGVLAILDVALKGFKALGDGIVGTNAKIEQATTSITALTGSAQTATDMVGKLETLASHSTFGLPQLTQSAQQLLAFGVAAQNVPPLLQAIQNAAAASGGDITEKLGRINYVIAELNSGIPVSARQLRQLATAGVPLKAIADDLGTTVDKLMEVGKTHEFTSEQIVTSFQKIYTSGNLGDFMSKQAQTFSGAMNLIKTNVTLAAAQAFQPLFQIISNLAVKIGEFVQTATFQEWVAQVKSAVSAAIDVFKSFMNVLAPVGEAIAKVFGLNTANIGEQMAAVKNATVDVGQYNAALQGGGGAADDTKAKLAGYTQQVKDATIAIDGLNSQLDTNKVLLDQNAQSIANVKNQYDPVIKSAEQSIRDINTPTADELQRKQRALELDRDKANLELTKPDTSSFDTKILSDQTTLDNLPRLDTSGWDTKITDLSAQITAAQAEDPAAGIKGQIADLQDALSSLNTNTFDEKINAIKDKLAEPAPDTHGIDNQLRQLNADLADGTISASSADSQRRTLELQKQGMNQKYIDDTSGLKGQLAILERQRADQQLANRETAQADRKRIEDLTEQAKIIEKGHADSIKGLEQERTAQEKLRTDAEKADAKRRQDLSDDIKKEQNLRAQALAPYEAAMKRITDAQAILSNQDWAAAAQRAIDLAPYQQALDVAKGKEEALLAPLLEQKAHYDEIANSLNQQKSTQEAKKSAAQGEAAALKEAAANAKSLTDALGGAAGTPDLAKLGRGETKDMAVAGADSPFVKFMHSLAEAINSLKQPMKDFLDGLGTMKDFIRSEVIPAVKDFYDWLAPKIKNAFTDATTQGSAFSDWLDKSLNPVLQTSKPLLGDLNNLMQDFDNISSHLLALTLPPLKVTLDAVILSLQGLKTGVDLLQTPLTVMTQLIAVGLHDALVMLHSLLDGAVESAFGTFTNKLTGDVAKATLGFIDNLGDNGLLKALGNVKSWVATEWGSLTSSLAKPFTDAWTDIGGFFDKLSQGINWLATHFKLPSIPAFVIGGAGTSTPSLPGHAAGLTDSPTGHFAMVGERGPELMFVPHHASIIPNHMLPGHAEGFNLGVLDDAVKAVGGAVKGMGAKLVDTLMTNIGVPNTDSVLPGMGTALAGQAKQGLLNWLAPADVAGRATSSGVGALGPLVGLIRAAASKYSVPADIIGAIILHESGGIIGRTEVGGGLGRGLMQVDGGTWPEAYDPRMSGTTLDDAAFQIDIGSMILKRAWDAAGGDVDKALTGYSGTGFAAVHGRDFYHELLDMGLIAAADSALAGGASLVGGVAGGGWPDVVAAAQSQVGHFFQDNGERWWFWCEKFVNDMDQRAGIAPHRANTAKEHDLTANLQGGMAPPGAAWYWSFDPAGHTAISTGDGGLIGTYPQGVAYGNISDFGQPDGWVPPGLAGGGLTIGGNPSLAVVGDGPPGEKEWHVPEPQLAAMLRDVVRRESSGGPTIAAGAVTVYIHPTPGMSEERVGEIAAAAVYDVMIGAPHAYGRQ